MPPSGISRVCRDRSLVANRENFRSVAMAMPVPRSAFNLRSTSSEDAGPVRVFPCGVSGPVLIVACGREDCALVYLNDPALVRNLGGFLSYVLLIATVQFRQCPPFIYFFFKAAPPPEASPLPLPNSFPI